MEKRRHTVLPGGRFSNIPVVIMKEKKLCAYRKKNCETY